MWWCWVVRWDEVRWGEEGKMEELNNWSYFYSLLSTLRLKTLRAGAGRLLPALVFWTYIEQKLTIRKEVFLKRAPLIKRNEKLEGSLVATRMSIVRYVVVLHLHTHHHGSGDDVMMMMMMRISFALVAGRSQIAIINISPGQCVCNSSKYWTIFKPL